MFNLKEILLTTNGKLINRGKKTSFSKVSTDSRQKQKNHLFIPLKGDTFDGHNFIEQAIKNGASGVLVSKNIAVNKNITSIKVKNTLRALQLLAKYHRNKINPIVIGITGSCGKTSTKDMLASILSKKFKTLKNRGNLNNQIGVPLTLLELDSSHQVAVIEMAIQKPGEMKEIAEIALPDISIITNIGPSHLKYFKTIKKIAQEKSKIFKYTKKIAVINKEDKFYNLIKSTIPNKIKIITFGLKNKLKGIVFPIPGEHIQSNGLAACAVAKILKISRAQIKSGLESFKLSDKRMNIFKTRKNITIINDSYNANPSSTAAALKTLASYKGRKLAILGDMLELGSQAKKFHIQTGKLANKLGINILISVGKISKNMPADYKLENSSKAISLIKKIIKPNDIVLIKGSRGMRMEKISEALR